MALEKYLLHTIEGAVADVTGVAYIAPREGVTLRAHGGSLYSWRNVSRSGSVPATKRESREEPAFHSLGPSRSCEVPFV